MLNNSKVHKEDSPRYSAYAITISVVQKCLRPLGSGSSPEISSPITTAECRVSRFNALI
ncbi:predicted protein [Botrytis cinerea T4]|uniref:Uncharacterized protein n=1 Tax=Botryotinia fuckeliana (strain T4) TaxID=999810 RepID=G2YHE0_BOTF4|nr:predicted protein [Botrytis cinerea T4]